MYNENWILDKNEITINTSHFIDDRLSIIQNELGRVDDNISDYKSQALMPDYMAVTGISLEQSKEIRERILTLNNQLSMAQYVQSHLRGATSREQLLPANSGIENTAVETLIAQYNELMMQKNVLLSNSSTKNPVVAEMIVNLNAMREVINSSINDYINTLSIQISSAEQQDRENKAYLASNPQQAKELLGVERQQMVKEGLYLYLLQKREENELSQTFSAYNTKVLNPADGNQHPVAPRMIVVLLLGFVIGVVIPVVYIIIRTSMDTLVKSKKDIVSLSLPYIGSIPHIGAGGRRKMSFKNKNKELDKKIVVEKDSRSISNESFRVIRTNLDFILAQNKGCNILQTISLNPSSGKSFITANLAVSISLKGAKVLLIDADMRMYALSKYFDTPKIGLSNYLSGKVDNVEEIIIKDALSHGIDIIPVGAIPPNPSELLLGDRFAAMVEKFRNQYDYILFDCPPVEIVPDSAIIGKYCTASLFIIRAGKFDKRNLSEIENIKNSGKYNNMSAILNDVKLSTKQGYGYGYGYGYGNK